MRFERWFYTLPLRVRSLFRRRRLETELDDELRYPLEHLIEQNIKTGMSRKDARYAALRAMGGMSARKNVAIHGALTSSTIVCNVLEEALVLVGAGVLIGVGCALAATRLIDIRSR